MDNPVGRLRIVLENILRSVIEETRDDSRFWAEMIGWSDEAFRERVAARAKELGITQAQLLARAGVSRELFYKLATDGRPPARRIDTLEKIAEACDWELAELMGFPGRRTRQRDVTKAYDATQEVMRNLPQWAHTKQRWIEAFTILYNELMLKVPEDGEIDNTTEREIEAYLSDCARLLARSLVVQAEGDHRSGELTAPELPPTRAN